MVSITFANDPQGQVKHYPKSALCKYSPVLKHALAFPSNHLVYGGGAVVTEVCDNADDMNHNNIQLTLHGSTPEAFQLVLDNMCVSSSLPGSMTAGFVHYGWTETVGIWKVGRLLEVEYVVKAMRRRLRSMDTYPLPSGAEAQAVYAITGSGSGSSSSDSSGSGSGNDDDDLPRRIMIKSIATHVLGEVLIMGMAKDSSISGSSSMPNTDTFTSRNEQHVWRRLVERIYDRVDAPGLQEAVARCYGEKRDKHLKDVAAAAAAAHAVLRSPVEENEKPSARDRVQEWLRRTKTPVEEEEEEPRGRTRYRAYCHQADWTI